MDKKIKVLVVDDHEMVRLGVTSYLSVLDHMEVVGQASDGADGVKQALLLKPDVILMDLVMDNMNGIEATKQILEQWHQAKIIIVTSFLDDEKVYPAIQLGACGYLLKTSTAQEIADAIEKVYRGEKIFEMEVIEKINHPVKPLHTHLTEREMEVLLLIAQGYSNQELSDKLFISLKTVKTHVSNILMKLNVDDRTQATIYAFQKGLIK